MSAPVVFARRLQYATIGWNAFTVAVSLPAAWLAGSVALAGFGLDSAVEMAASVVVLMALRRPNADHRRYLLLIRLAFVAIAFYLIAQAAFVLTNQDRPEASPIGIVLLAATVVVMSTLAYLKARVGRQMGNAVVSAEARVTLIDSLDSLLVLVALLANAVLGWWWMDPIAGVLLAAYSLWEAFEHR